MSIDRKSARTASQRPPFKYKDVITDTPRESGLSESSLGHNTNKLDVFELSKTETGTPNAMRSLILRHVR